MSARAWTKEDLSSLHADLTGIAARLTVQAASWQSNTPAPSARPIAKNYPHVRARRRSRRFIAWIFLPILGIVSWFLADPGFRARVLSSIREIAAMLPDRPSDRASPGKEVVNTGTPHEEEVRRHTAAEQEARRRAVTAEEARQRAAAAEEEARRRETAAEEARQRAAAAEEQARRRELAEQEARQRAASAAEAEIRRQREEEEERRRNPTATFRLKFDHPNSVSVQFRSDTNPSKFWPGADEHYVIRDSGEHEYRLRCDHGEKICFGAWVEGSALNPYWARGYRVRENCSRCCLTCPSEASWALDASDITTPSPSITWNIKSDYPYAVSLVFYSSTRSGHQWPGDNREYRLQNYSVQTYKIGCIRGEKVCYGAWPTGNPNGGYWGAGFGGRQGCQNCCRWCDGTESNVINLN